MQNAIAGFLSYARERLAPLGVYVAADVFGLVTTSKDDMNLGQHLEILATSVDIICPMVYPSHYDLGSYGVKYPDADINGWIFWNAGNSYTEAGFDDI